MKELAFIRFSPYALIPLVGFIVLVVLSILVLSRKRKDGSHISFAIINLATAAWNLDIFLIYTLTDVHLVHLIDRAFQPIIVIIPLAWINFVTVFLRSRHRRLLVGVCSIWTLFLVFISPSRYFISETVPMYFGHYSVAGPLYILYVITHIAALIVATFILLIHYRKTVGPVMKKQIGYFLMATVILGILSADNFFPLYGVEKYPLGNIAVIIYLVIIGLAIMLHGFLDIEAIIRKSLIYSIATFLLTSLYLGLILLMEGLVRVYLLPESLFIPLIPALVVAFVFQGVKEKVQSWLDNVFGYERKRTALLSSFARLSQATSSRLELTSLFCQKIDAALQPEKQAFFTRDADPGLWRIETDGGLRQEDTGFLRDEFLPAVVTENTDIVYIPDPGEMIGNHNERKFHRVSRMGFHLLVPLKGRSAVAGACLLGQKSSGGRFTGEDKAFIGAIAGHAAAALEAREYCERWKKEERFTALGRASATISHELRNPLNVIKGAVLYLKKRCKGETISKFTDIISQEVDKTTFFIEQLLRASRIPPSCRRRIEATEWFRRFADGWAGRYPGVNVTVTVPTDQVWASLDPLLLDQMFENVCRNAAEAMQMKGNIALKLEFIRPYMNGTAYPNVPAPERGMIVFTVADDGPGIAYDQREAVFDPFFTTKEEGTGLGLCVVDGVVRAHGGQFKLDFPHGGGVAFKISLPIEKGDKYEGGPDA